MHLLPAFQVAKGGKWPGDHNRVFILGFWFGCLSIHLGFCRVIAITEAALPFFKTIF